MRHNDARCLSRAFAFLRESFQLSGCNPEGFATARACGMARRCLECLLRQFCQQKPTPSRSLPGPGLVFARWPTCRLQRQGRFAQIAQARAVNAATALPSPHRPPVAPFGPTLTVLADEYKVQAAAPPATVSREAASQFSLSLHHIGCTGWSPSIAASGSSP
jgi:hypothetical protein